MNILKKSGASVAGNTDLDFTVDAYTKWKVLYGQTDLTTDATVADRRVVVSVLDDAGTPNIIFDSHAGAVVSASSSNQHHEFMPGIYRETSFQGNSLQVPIPDDMILDSGWTLRVTVENGVAGDSHDSYFVIKEIGDRR